MARVLITVLFPADALEKTRLWAIEFLIPLAVTVGELNHEFKVRAVKTRISLDLPIADRKDPLHVRYFRRAEINIPAG